MGPIRWSAPPSAASLVFLIARTSVGSLLRERAGPALRSLEAGFKEDGASYLLFLRLVPLFPFWLVNLVPAFFGVSLRTFVLCSFFGMVPGTLRLCERRQRAAAR